MKSKNKLEPCPLTLFFSEKMASRKKANYRYSMRAFARDLQLSSGRLSDLLHGKHIPGKRLQERIIANLKLSDQERDRFLAIIEAKRQLKKFGIDRNTYQLREDEFAHISDWEHFAILNLISTDNFISDNAWIANRLNISVDRASSALERLNRLNILAKNSRGDWVKNHNTLATVSDTPSTALRESHRQSINQALDALKSQPIDLRDITSISFPMDIDAIPEAKEEIRQFCMKMGKLLSQKERKRTEVYSLNIQLFSLTDVKR